MKLPWLKTNIFYPILSIINLAHPESSRFCPRERICDEFQISNLCIYKINVASAWINWLCSCFLDFFDDISYLPYARSWWSLKKWFFIPSLHALVMIIKEMIFHPFLTRARDDHCSSRILTFLPKGENWWWISNFKFVYLQD